MEKLELKHIVGYLPYDLKVLSGFGEYSEIDSLYFSKDGHKRPSLNLMVSHFPKGFRGENFKEIKPILRPLSDLTKEIEVNGEKFIPIIALAKLFFCAKSAVLEHKDIIDAGAYGIQVSCFYDEHRYAYYQIFGDIDLIEHNEYRVVQKLYEWHFDIHDLIGKGLAIDINTLK